MIALIFCGDLKYCPYLKRYIERIEKQGVEHCVLFWNRSGAEFDLPKNYFHFDCSSDLNKSKIGKFFDFVKFKKWVIAKIKEVSPDKIVALSTLTGVLLGKDLYNAKIPYAFDVRDYSYEHIYPFYSIEKKLIKNSTFTAISSKGFTEFLPAHEYVIAHNFNRNDIGKNAKFVKDEKTIRFVWNGVMRYFDCQKQYLEALKNDERFEIVFHGDGPHLELYKSYCKENNYKNVIFTGYYDNSQKEMLLKNAHILNNCYGIRGKENKVKYAVSNRFYDGIIYHIPQIVEPEGYKSEWVKKSGVGENFAVENNFADKLYEYYTNLDVDSFNKACKAVLDEVINEDDKFIAVIDDFITR